MSIDCIKISIRYLFLSFLLLNKTRLEHYFWLNLLWFRISFGIFLLKALRHKQGHRKHYIHAYIETRKKKKIDQLMFPNKFLGLKCFQAIQVVWVSSQIILFPCDATTHSASLLARIKRLCDALHAITLYAKYHAPAMSGTRCCCLCRVCVAIDTLYLIHLTSLRNAIMRLKIAVTSSKRNKSAFERRWLGQPFKCLWVIVLRF